MTTTSNQSAAYAHLREEHHFNEPDAKEFLNFLNRHNLFDRWLEWMRSEGFKIGDVKSESKVSFQNESSPYKHCWSDEAWNHERRDKQNSTKNENKISSDTIMGFTAILAILLIVLKLTGALNWSWVWVLFPIWIWPALPVALFLFCIVSKIWSGLSK